MDTRSIRVGRLGEQAAARYLEGRGYRVLDRNWRSPDPEQRGELDLVLSRRGELVVCEVKTRTGGALAHPAEAVTEQKAARLRRLAVVWLRCRPRRRRGAEPRLSGIRIDVVAVRLGPQEPFPLLSVQHLEGVA